MDTKEIHIKKDTKAAQDVKAYRENKQAFRNAAKEGKAVDYARANAQSAAQPV